MNHGEDDPTEKIKHRRVVDDPEHVTGWGWIILAVGFVMTAAGIGAAIGMQWCNP